MNDTLRYILAGSLIFLIILLQPLYLDWLGYDAGGEIEAPEVASERSRDLSLAEDKNESVGKAPYKKKSLVSVFAKEVFTTISTPLYTATITNRSGGSFVEYTIKDESSGKLKYVGCYDSVGSFHSDLPVSLIMPSETNCTPCLAHYNDRIDQYVFFNEPYLLVNPPSVDTVFLDFDQEYEFQYELRGMEGEILIKKSVLFSANKYLSEHVFEIKNDNYDHFNMI